MDGSFPGSDLPLGRGVATLLSDATASAAPVSAWDAPSSGSLDPVADHLSDISKIRALISAAKGVTTGPSVPSSILCAASSSGANAVPLSVEPVTACVLPTSPILSEPSLGVVNSCVASASG